MRRNPDPSRSPRRGEGWALPLEVRRARLMRRWGWPRGFVVRGAWFLEVDVGLASPAWVGWAYALPPRPRAPAASVKGRAWLARLKALRPAAALERTRLARGGLR